MVEDASKRGARKVAVGHPVIIAMVYAHLGTGSARFVARTSRRGTRPLGRLYQSGARFARLRGTMPASSRSFEAPAFHNPKLLNPFSK